MEKRLSQFLNGRVYHKIKFVKMCFYVNLNCMMYKTCRCHDKHKGSFLFRASEEPRKPQEKKYENSSAVPDRRVEILKSHFEVVSNLENCSLQHFYHTCAIVSEHPKNILPNDAPTWSTRRSIKGSWKDVSIGASHFFSGRLDGKQMSRSTRAESEKISNSKPFVKLRLLQFERHCLIIVLLQIQ